ncbi:MAG: ATP-grasp domain-containing protein [Lachnospiraceae bacterium]|nr:ATP-grasp domain-containing protein [Lachnospiraceae bacterium]
MKTKHNILVTSAGRRGYIIDYFKEVLNGNGKVHVGNSNIFSAAMSHGDRSVITPNIYDQNYVEFLLDYCMKEEIDIIVPLFDIDLPILAKNEAVFKENGVRVIVSDYDVVSVCNDKWETYQFCKNNGIFCPISFIDTDDLFVSIDKGIVSYPIIVKPRRGMGSLSVYMANNEDELRVLSRKCNEGIQNTYLKYEASDIIEKAVIYQEYIKGQEYAVDVINDLDGNYITCSVKKKIAMRAGETDCAMMVKEEMLERLSRRISLSLRHIANLDVDIMMKEDGHPFLIEMNARLGGGYPFSHLAGINLPKAIVKWIDNEEITEELSIMKYGEIYQKDISFVSISQNVR